MVEFTNFESMGGRFKQMFKNKPLKTWLKIFAPNAPLSLNLNLTVIYLYQQRSK